MTPTNSFNEYTKAQSKYKSQYDYINDADSKLTYNDFYELARLREERDRAFENFYLSDENFISEDNSSDF